MVENGALSSDAPVSSDPLRQIRWALRDARHPKLTGTVRAVLGAIVDRYPDMRPSVPRIASDAGVARATAFRALDELKKLGILSASVVPGKGASYTINQGALAGLDVPIPRMDSKVRSSRAVAAPVSRVAPVASCDPSHGATGQYVIQSHGATATSLTVRPKGNNGREQSEEEILGGAQALPPGTTLETGETSGSGQVKTSAECRTVPMYSQDVPPCPRCGRVSHGDAACQAQPLAPKQIASLPSAAVGNQLALLPLADEAPPTKPSPSIDAKRHTKPRRAPKANTEKKRTRILAEGFAKGHVLAGAAGFPVPFMKHETLSLCAVADARCAEMSDVDAADWIAHAVGRFLRARKAGEEEAKFVKGGDTVQGFVNWIGTEKKADAQRAEVLRLVANVPKMTDDEMLEYDRKKREERRNAPPPKPDAPTVRRVAPDFPNPYGVTRTRP